MAACPSNLLWGYRVSSAGTDLAEPNADCEYDTTANDNLDDGVSELAAAGASKPEEHAPRLGCSWLGLLLRHFYRQPSAPQPW
jgi:hypothetical protein